MIKSIINIIYCINFINFIHRKYELIVLKQFIITL